MIRNIVLVMAALFGGFLHAETVEFEPKGEFAQVETGEDAKLIEKLLKLRKSAIEDVLSTPNDYSPPVLYALSYALFERKRKDEAMFWFYAGQLRARSDANKALDLSARQAVEALNQQFGPNINQYAFNDIPKLRRTVESVVKWDSENERHYDPRWISLHGMDSFSEEVIAFEPKENWQSINEQTRVEYLNGFYEAVGRGDR